MKNKTFAVLQKVGKSLMLPVSVLPAAGLLVAFGRIIENASMAPDGSVQHFTMYAIATLMFKGGIAILSNCPLFLLLVLPLVLPQAPPYLVLPQPWVILR